MIDSEFSLNRLKLKCWEEFAGGRKCSLCGSGAPQGENWAGKKYLEIISSLIVVKTMKKNQIEEKALKDYQDLQKETSREKIRWRVVETR